MICWFAGTQNAAFDILSSKLSEISPPPLTMLEKMHTLKNNNSYTQCTSDACNFDNVHIINIKKCIFMAKSTKALRLSGGNIFS